VQKEIEIKRKIQDIVEELEGSEQSEQDPSLKKKKKRDPQVLTKEKSQLEIELSAGEVLPKNGWVLVDFPTNFA
jgi:hypothetical protein